MHALVKLTTKLGRDVFSVYWTLLKIMVPSLIIVKILEMLGAIKALAVALKPLMALVGLPPEMGVVWATSLLTNLYTAMAVYFDLASQYGLTGAQITILGMLMLMGHGLPVEGMIAKKSGVRWRVTLLLRIGIAFLLAMVLSWFFNRLNLLQQPATLLWQPAASDASLLGWAVAQVKVLAMIPLIIAALMIGLAALRKLGIEKLIHALLAPLLKLLGMSKAAANSTVIGITLGLSFGGGLLIKEALEGKMSKQDILLSMSLLCLCHSLIEDTLLILLLGANLHTILWLRLAFSLLIISLFSFALNKNTTGQLLHWAMNQPKR